MYHDTTRIFHISRTCLNSVTLPWLTVAWKMRIHVSSSHDHCWQGSTQVHAKKNDLSLSGDDVHTVLLALQGHDLSKLLTWPLPPHVADVASFPFPFPLTPLKTRMRNGAKFLMFVFLRTLYTVGNTSRSRDPRGPRASPAPHTSPTCIRVVPGSLGTT